MFSNIFTYFNVRRTDITFISVTILYVLTICITSAEEPIVGSFCIRENDGAFGIYRPHAECSASAEGVEGSLVICCAEVEITPGPTTENTTAGNENITDGRVEKRLSEIKCEEYYPPQEILEPPPPGIVGGEGTFAGEFPHMVAIGRTSTDGEIDWFCGGSLISEEYVLTAAHCTGTSTKPEVARLGEQNLKSLTDGANPIDVLIDKVIPHPGYKYPSKYNDISLLKLRSLVAFTEYIRPACLWQSGDDDYTAVVSTGWGRTGFTESTSDDLLKVTLFIIDNADCIPYFVNSINRKLVNGIVDTQLCAGDLKGGKDTCQGDSGGPIQIHIVKPFQRIFHILGITSFGSGCGVPDSPGVYTRVSKYLEWIEGVVWPGQL